MKLISNIRHSGDFTSYAVKTLEYLFLIFFFLNIFPHVNAIRDLCFYLAVLIALILFCLKKHDLTIKSPLLLPFAMFVVWALATSLFAHKTADSFHSFYSHLIRYIVLYFILINYFASQRDLVRISWSIIISTVCCATGILIYFYWVLNNPLGHRLGLESLATNIISFGTIFAMLLSLRLLYAERIIYRKAFLTAGIFILALTTLLTQSRAAFLSIFVSSLIILSGRKKILFFFLAALATITLLLPVTHRISEVNINDKVRIGLLYYSLEIVKDYPVTGAGFAIDTFKNERLTDREKYAPRIPEKYRDADFILPHSMFLSLLVRTGVIGLILWLNILFVLARMCWRVTVHGKTTQIREWGRCMLAALAMFMTGGMFEPVFIHFLDTIFYTICAMITILWFINERTAADGSGEKF